MSDLKRIPVIAVVLIVLLRLSIGWQFLYEGMWKYDTLDTSNPWSAEGYLKVAQGPFRDHFRSMTGDPDDLGWLNYDNVSSKWNRWRNRFVGHYGLSEEQQKQLDLILNGTEVHEANLEQLPPGVKLDAVKEVLSFDAAAKKVVAQLPLKPEEVAALKSAAGVTTGEDGKEQVPPAAVSFVKALDSLGKSWTNLGARQKLRASLMGDPDRVGVQYFGEKNSIEMGTPSPSAADASVVKYGEIQEYRDLVADYNRMLTTAKTSYQFAHAEKVGLKLATLRTKVVGPVRALEAQLKEDAQNLLTASQQTRGALPPEDSQLQRANMQAMWGLLILGTLLIIGLGTRVAAVAGAVMLTMFYLVVPPWPGVSQPPGPEHALFVNKNIIEAIALLGIAALPTGSWFGLDGICYRLWLWKNAPRSAPPAA